MCARSPKLGYHRLAGCSYRPLSSWSAALNGLMACARIRAEMGETLDFARLFRNVETKTCSCRRRRRCRCCTKVYTSLDPIPGGRIRSEFKNIVVLPYTFCTALHFANLLVGGSASLATSEQLGRERALTGEELLYNMSEDCTFAEGLHTVRRGESMQLL